MSRPFQFIAIAALAGRALASCAYGTHLAPRAEGGQVEINTFGYSGLIGPTNWVSLDSANILCAMGSHQSPIDMVDGQFNMIPASAINLQIGDMPEGTEFENLGTTVEVVAPEGLGSMSVGEVDFALQQFHFHLPSEHLDNGTSRAMEMHMVWESEAGDIAVIGVYIDVDMGAQAEGEGEAPAQEANAEEEAATATAEATAEGTAEETAAATAEETAEETAEATATEEAGVEGTAAEDGAETAAAERRWVGRMARMPKRTTGPAKAKKSVQLRASQGAATSSNLLETVFASLDGVTQPGSVTKTQPLVMSELVDVLNAGQFQAYTGSLTTPPCSEGVTWLVSTQRLQVQAATFGNVRDIIGFNARFPQNLLGEPNLLQVGAVAMTQALRQFQVAQSFGGVH